MWYTCHKWFGTGNIESNQCSICSQYNVYHNGTLTFYGHIWCDDDIIPITPPSSP